MTVSRPSEKAGLPDRLPPRPTSHPLSSPLVSILVPAYRAAPWLVQTLDSALAQTHPRCEIIVVDDGSPDDTLAIAQAHAARHPSRIRVATQPNSGAAAARNHALRLATGDYIQFLDADDLLSPRKIERQLARLASTSPFSVATCRWGRFETDPAAARFVDEEVFRDFTPIDWLILHASALRMMHPAAWLAPRAVVEKAGPWTEALSLNDDGEYFARIALASSGIAFTPEADAATYYRSNLDGSLSNQKSPRALASLHHSGGLLARHLLAAEDSPRVRQTLADHWKLLCYELYPGAPALSRDAEARSLALGGSAAPQPIGGKTRALARLVGWRLARRLSSLTR